MELPGRIGFSFLGDESIEFVRDPLSYMHKRRSRYGSVFVGRILNKPTVFLTSSDSVHELLQNKVDCFSGGYKEYMLELFDESLVFLEGDVWRGTRDCLEKVFDHQAVTGCVETSRRIIQEHYSKLDLKCPRPVYETFKALATRLSIALFLGHDLGEELAQKVSELMTTHWRGIISVPLHVRIPFSGWSSGYGKALKAKKELLDIIQHRLKQNPSNIISRMRKELAVEDQVVTNLLLFISALIPKAFASLLTSLVMELSKPENEQYLSCTSEERVMEDMLLEVQRLWPPFLGGRRVCNKSCTLMDYQIPKGHAVAYISMLANRDPNVFPMPDDFRPERWRNENVDDRERVWTFGGGPRGCVGKHLSNILLKECTRELLVRFKWMLSPGQDLSHKLLPVTRPKEDVEAMFELRDENGKKDKESSSEEHV